jgi:signal transduction histidine kinase
MVKPSGAVTHSAEFNHTRSKRSFAEIQNKPNQITIRTTEIDNQIKIEISDNGGGIPDAFKEQIFEYLFTIKDVRKGLGLTIAQQIIVEKHHGSLTCTSTPNEGTRS